MKIVKIAALLLATVALIETAAADKLCLQSTVNKKTFKVTTKSVVAATCPSGYSAIIDTARFLNLSACRLVTKQCSHSAGGNSCNAECAQGEYVLQYTAAHSSDFCLVNPIYSPPASSAVYSNGLSAGVRYISGAGCSYTATVNALCCPRS